MSQSEAGASLSFCHEDKLGGSSNIFCQSRSDWVVGGGDVERKPNTYAIQQDKPAVYFEQKKP